MNDIEESFSLQYDPTFFFHPFIPHQRRICIECHGAAIGQSHMSDLSKSGRFLDLTTTKYQVTQTTDHQNQAACGHPYPFPKVLILPVEELSCSFSASQTRVHWRSRSSSRPCADGSCLINCKNLISSTSVMVSFRSFSCSFFISTFLFNGFVVSAPIDYKEGYPGPLLLSH